MQQTNPRGVTPLMWAAASSGEQAPEVLNLLLQHDANIASQDESGWVALHHACRNGRRQAVQQLIIAKAEPSRSTGDGRSCIMLATIEGKPELVAELFKSVSYKVEATKKDARNLTALHYAVTQGTLDTLKILIEHNARVNARDDDGQQPLTIAAQKGRDDCVALLVKKRAEINCHEENRRTPLLHACLGGHEGLAQWLFERRADPHAADEAGDSPMSLADEMGLKNFKKLVESHAHKQRKKELEEE